jgi:hypothetical protein
MSEPATYEELRAHLDLSRGRVRHLAEDVADATIRIGSLGTRNMALEVKVAALLAAGNELAKALHDWSDMYHDDTAVLAAWSKAGGEVPE